MNFPENKRSRNFQTYVQFMSYMFIMFHEILCSGEKEFPPAIYYKTSSPLVQFVWKELLKKYLNLLKLPSKQLVDRWMITCNNVSKK